MLTGKGGNGRLQHLSVRQVEAPRRLSPGNLGSWWKEVEAGLYYGEEVSPEPSLGPLRHQPLSPFLGIHVAFSTRIY